MARYPDANWRPLGAQTEPKITPTCVVLHTAVSNSQSLFDFFAREGYTGVESHFYNPASKSYPIEQYQDTERQADAQFAGNAYGISIESWDHADPDHVAWSEDQLDRNAEICAWAHEVHGIPLVTAYKDGDVIRGIGYHAQFHEWNLTNHSCPGPMRIPQVPEVIKRAKAIVAAGGTSAGGRTGGGTSRDGNRRHHYTHDDVKAMQRLVKVTVDGKYGPNTARAVHEVTHVAYWINGGSPWPKPGVDVIKKVQRVLGVADDGDIGPITEGAMRDLIRAMQKDAPLHVATVDGWYGPTTHQHRVWLEHDQEGNY